MGALADFRFQGHVKTRWTEIKIAFVFLQMFKGMGKILCELWDQVDFVFLFQSAIKAHSCAD
jgi:hypothetical protein